MNVRQGKIHNYLGIIFEYTEGVTIKVGMIDYIDEIVAAFDKPEPRECGIKTSMASEYLYKVDEYCEKLSTDKANMFHDLVSKTLYTTKRVSPDTCADVAFLTTIVIQPNKD